jgi:hypothetical protein
MWFSVLWSVALAAEGMWTPDQLPARAESLRAAGFELPAAQLAQLDGAPVGAIVSLGFCSGSFVSADGLVITNHHCAEGFLALNSNDGVDYVADGFWAPDREHELPAGPGARLYLIEQITDHTATVERALAGVSVEKRTAARDRLSTSLVSACEKARGRRCFLRAEDGGVAWKLFKTLEIRDVRVVAAPPASVGFFGGDLDNFEWPRHDADFAFLRAWVGPDGLPADPSPKNVPYTPKHWLPIDRTGAQPDEPVMSIGFPGSTDRHAPFADLDYAYRTDNPRSLADLRLLEQWITEERKADERANTLLQSAQFDLANSRKYVEGIQDNVAASDVLATKALLDERMRRVADASSQPASPLRRALDDLDAARAATIAEAPLSDALGWLFNVDRFSVAHRAVRWAIEQTKKDADRKPGFQERDRRRIEASFTELDESFWAPLDERVLTEALRRVAALPAAQQPTPLAALLARHGGDPAAAVAAELRSNALDTAAARLALLDQPIRSLRASKDPYVRLAVEMEDALLAARRTALEERESRVQMAWPIWVRALKAELGADYYPDANGTMRVSYGRVRGYAPRDGLLATPQTTLSGLLAKDRLETYAAPAWLVSAAAQDQRSSPWYDRSLSDIPVDFLSDLDTTGGNSGSATLNARGELVGLVFDGNYESMAADWQYDGRLTRTIHLDIRYILWLLEQQTQARWLLAELGVAGG